MKKPEVSLQLPAADGGKKRKMAIPADRLQEITQICCDRLTECRTEMGLDFGTGGNWALSPVGRPDTWAWKRQCARVEYAGNFDHREALGGVFLENNWSLNVPARFVKLLESKYSDDLVGTEPFFAAMPEKMDDPKKTDLCKQVEKKVQHEIGKSNLGQTLRESIRVALTEGERTVKLTWKVDKTQYLGTDTVMIDKTGKPVLTAKGDYIYKNDDTVDVVVDEQGNFLRPITDKDLDPQTGQPTLQPGEQMQTRLEKEPTFIFPPTPPQFALIAGLQETIEHYNGLRADGMFCEDFIYPIYMPRLSDADIMAHCYDAALDDIENNYPGSNYGEKIKAKGDAFKWLQQTSALSAEGNPILERGEQLRETKTRKLINIHETYYRCRVNPTDKYDSWLFIVIDFLNRQPISCEFLGNMNMKRPPFAIIRGLESQPGRAYGIGVYEKWAHKALAVDLCFNRIALKSSKSASVTAYYPEAFQETKNGQPLVLGGKEMYKLVSEATQGIRPWGKDNPPVVRFNLAEVDEWTLPMMEKLIQTGQLEFGIVSAADGSSEDLNSSKTATGIRNIERTGNVVQRSTESLLTCDIEELLELAADIILQNMDEMEAQFLPGENRLATLAKDEVLNLPRDVRLLLTKAKSQDGIDSAQTIITTITGYYALQPALQKKVRPAYLQILKDLYVADADELLDDPTEEDIAAAAQAQKNGPKASEVIQLKGADLTATQKDALAQQFGLPAATPQEMQAAQQAALPPPEPGAPPAGPTPPVAPMPPPGPTAGAPLPQSQRLAA